MTAIAFFTHPEKNPFATLAGGKKESSIPNHDDYLEEGYKVEAIVTLNTKWEGTAALAALVKLEDTAADGNVTSPSILLLFSEIFMEGRKSATN